MCYATYGQYSGYNQHGCLLLLGKVSAEEKLPDPQGTLSGTLHYTWLYSCCYIADKENSFQDSANKGSCIPSPQHWMFSCHLIHVWAYIFNIGVFTSVRQKVKRMHLLLYPWRSMAFDSVRAHLEMPSVCNMASNWQTWAQNVWPVLLCWPHSKGGLPTLQHNEVHAFDYCPVGRDLYRSVYWSSIASPWRWGIQPQFKLSWQQGKTQRQSEQLLVKRKESLFWH